jgi:hypothetical protein
MIRTPSPVVVGKVKTYLLFVPAADDVGQDGVVLSGAFAAARAGLRSPPVPLSAWTAGVVSAPTAAVGPRG